MKPRIVDNRGRREVGGYVVPLSYTVEVDDPVLDFTYEIDVDNSGPSPRVAAVVCIARDTTSSVRGDQLRAVKIASVVAEAAQSLHVPARPLGRAGRVVGAGYPLSDVEHAEYLRGRRREERAGLRRVTDEDLRRVAAVYEAALAAGQPPARAVEEALRLSTRDQARRWVQKARDSGYLGPAPGERQRGAGPLDDQQVTREIPNLPNRSVKPRPRPPGDGEPARQRTTRRKP